jgi:hypothetical protein
VSGLDESVKLSVTKREALELCAGLRVYIRSMGQQAASDPAGSHSDRDLDRLRLHFGQLIWRLEEAALSHGGVIEHGDDAVSPEQTADCP